VVEAGELYVIDTRTAKRSPRAAVCVAASLVRERIITEREALLRLDPKLMDFFLHPMIVSQTLLIATTLHPVSLHSAPCTQYSEPGLQEEHLSCGEKQHLTHPLPLPLTPFRARRMVSCDATQHLPDPPICLHSARIPPPKPHINAVLI